MLDTRFTERFVLRTPIAQAGMAFAGMTPALASAVDEGGGLGAVAVGAAPPQIIDAFVDGFAQMSPDRPLDVNFITIFTTDEHIEAVCRRRPAVVSFHWGHPPQKWIDALRAADISVWEQVGTVDAAVTAVDSGVEVVVAQGTEAGGHNLATLSTLAFVPAVVDAIEDRAMVLASGGIVDGRTLAAALALGADGAWIGTRLVATPESSAADEYKERLLSTTGAGTVRTSIFGPETPSFNPMRVVRNAIVTECEADPTAAASTTDGQPIIGAMDLMGQPMELLRFTNFVPMAGATGDFDQLPLLAGEGVGQVTSIIGAAEVVRTMAADAEKILNGGER